MAFEVKCKCEGCKKDRFTSVLWFTNGKRKWRRTLCRQCHDSWHLQHAHLCGKVERMMTQKSYSIWSRIRDKFHYLVGGE